MNRVLLFIVLYFGKSYDRNEQNSNMNLCNKTIHYATCLFLTLCASLIFLIFKEYTRLFAITKNIQIDNLYFLTHYNEIMISHR